MIELPDFDLAWDHENAFHLTCDITRVSKMMAHYDLFTMTKDLPGAFVECGVFKGASFARFAAFRQLLAHPASKKLIGFDSFDEFPATQHEPDVAYRERFVAEAGSQSISIEQLLEVLERKGIGDNVELVAGDICETVPKYVREHPELRLSMINLDTDVYEPAVVVLRELYPRLVPGGCLIVDDYGVFPGESQAVDEFFDGTKARIQKFPYALSPCFIIKDEWA